MKLKLWLSLLVCGCTIVSAYCQTKTKYTSHVDPFIGTMKDGNVFAGACLPHGFVKLGSDNKYPAGAAGYKHDKEVLGFSHMHITGMAGPMYGNIQLIPTTGAIESLNHISAKNEEIVSPGYYKVGLKKYHTIAELTTTAHVGFHRYTFPKGKDSHVLVDAGATLYGIVRPLDWGSSNTIGGEIHIDSANKAIYGYNTFKGGRSTTKPWRVYFYAVFDTPFESYGMWNDSTLFDAKQTIAGKKIGGYFNFITKQSQAIQVKVGISMISTEKAKQSMMDEIPDWSFDRIKNAANDKWEAELSKIETNYTQESENRKFYTALYHSLLVPSDWTGENPIIDNKRPYYEDFLCIWDIYRTVCPLLTLISTREQRDMLNTLLDIYKQDGWLPDAHSALQREWIQVGTTADVLFADAFAKSMKGVDYETAFKAMQKNAEDTTNEKSLHAGRAGLASYLKYHYLPADAKFKGKRLTVSRTLEYIYSDYCLYQLAKGLHKDEEAKKYKSRCDWYKNVWDSDLKLVRGRNMDGTWIEPFDPQKSETGPCFYEGHAYTWTYDIPHDVKGLINLFGGEKVFLDSLTNAVSHHYEAWNEPCMLQIYLFIWAGRPDLAQQFIRKALAENFTDNDDGLPGNDDSGTTSAWYLWNRMGIFPVAGQNLYIIGSPSNESTIMHMESGKNLVIKAQNASPKNVYIQSAKLNGKPYNKAFFFQEDIVNGATFEFVMGAKPSGWGKGFVPPSLSK
ncbi:GH92 family glycosyl hydrolase [Parasediminibacterium sp. JCM 36343]|uniref:GH92 family glycosyl hydrolase n=1 Tax=Parasediminibacterium sp. JCM 36343 TaxID=3374279 RepID=UPI0039797E01